jgi:hypothetical protein
LDEITDAINYDPVIKPYKRLSEMTRYRSTMSKELICRKLGTLLDVHEKDESENNRLQEDTNDYVFFNHHSVREFFHQYGNPLLSNCEFVDDKGPVVYLARTCLYYLSAEAFNEIPSEKTSEFKALVQKARKATVPTAFLYMIDVFEGECEKLSDRFHFLKYASAGWYKHIKTRQQGEQEWNKIKGLLDHEQSFLALWIRGHWESGICIFHHPMFEKGEALGFRLSDLATELDICWLTELMLAEQIVEDRFTEEQIIDMVSRSPNSFQYLCICRKEIKMPDNVLMASAKSRNGRRGVQFLLEHRRAEIKLTQRVIEAAAAFQSDHEGKELVELLLDQDDAKNLEITDECLRSAAQTHGGRLMRLFLTRKVGKVNIVDELLKVAVETYDGVEVVQFLLEYFGSRVKVTEDLLIAAATRGICMLELLLERGKHEAKITEAIIRAATESSEPNHTLKHLLQRASKDVKITEDILAAASESFSAPKLIEILLEESGKELMFTERVLQATSRGPNGGRVLEIVLSQYNAAVEITNRLLLSAINHSANNRKDIDVMELLLNQSHKKIQVAETDAEHAVRELTRSQEMRSVLEMRCAGARITETLLMLRLRITNVAKPWCSFFST